MRTSVATVQMSNVKAAANAAGSHWFDPGAMRFFRTRLPLNGLADSKGRVWFVTSEAPRNGPRKFSVRVFIPQSGRVLTHGEFRSYSTRSIATRVMRAAIAAETDPLSSN